MRVIADGPLAAVGSAMPVKIAKGIIAAYPVPFGRPGSLGVPGPLLHLEANVNGVKSDTPQLVNSIHTLDSLHFSSSRSSSLFSCSSLSQPGPNYPLSSSFCFSCPASSSSGTSSPIQGSHPLFLPSSVPCSSPRPEQGVYPLCTSAEIRLPTSTISLSVQAPPTEVPYQTVVSPSRPLLPCGAPPLEPFPLEDHFSPLHLPALVSPIRVDRLELELRGHRDQAKVAYVISGPRNGFHLGFHSSSISLKSATGNMPSALLQPSVIDSYLQNELLKGWIASPLPIPPLPNLHTSRFGVIPKQHKPGKWHLLLDLSSPVGASVNDRIPKDVFSVQYMSVDDIIDGIMTYGCGTLMAKFDIESAYRIVPVHLDDRFLLGMQWRGNFFIDLALPFGLRSAPYIFSAIADLLEWIVRCNYHVAFLKHYLDDFHNLGPPDSLQWEQNLATCIKLFSDWGVPLHTDKFEGPSTVMRVLGIELDSLALQARLPKETFNRISSLIDEWSCKRHCKQKNLESLIGNLEHACKVIPQGRTLMRRMINLLSAFRKDDHPIRLNKDFHLDLTWWRDFFRSWDGCSFFLSPQWAPLPDFQVSSNSAGTLGYGALFKRDCFAGAWSSAQMPLSIAYKELFPVVLAATLWGPQWLSRRVEFCSDNMAVVEVLPSGTSRDPNLMALLRRLSLLAAQHCFSFTATHIVGKRNPVADALSHFNFQEFHLLAPHAASAATPIPADLLEELQVL